MTSHLRYSRTLWPAGTSGCHLAYGKECCNCSVTFDCLVWRWISEIDDILVSNQASRSSATAGLHVSQLFTPLQSFRWFLKVNDSHWWSWTIRWSTVTMQAHLEVQIDRQCFWVRTKVASVQYNMLSLAWRWAKKAEILGVIVWWKPSVPPICEKPAKQIEGSLLQFTRMTI